MNRLTRLLEIEVPIIQGGMGNISNAKLTSAISNAGALGTLGVGTMTPDEVRDLIKETKKQTTKPFAVNIPIKVTPYLKEMFSLIVEQNVPIVSLSAGNPATYIPFLQENGIKVISVVASVKQAIKVEKAGADVIVAEGYEAAGINSNLETTTLTLIPQIVNQVQIPVVAAGGIADGKGLASMLVLGAEGVQMGTRFITTVEAPFHDQYKQNIIQASDEATVIVGRSVGRIRRILKTDYAEKLLKFENEGISQEHFDLLTSEQFHKIGALEGNSAKGFMNAGQIAGAIDDIPTVQELIERIMLDAKNQLKLITESFLF